MNLGSEEKTVSALSSVPVRLIQLGTEDGAVLDALLYDPPSVDRSVAIIHLHGKGTSFLSGPGRFIPPLWPEVLHLSLNMRFRDLAFTRTDIQDEELSNGKIPAGIGGGFWERTADGNLDIAAAVAYLKESGASRILLAGHSSGGMYTGIYGATHPEIFARVLISPLTSSRTAFPRWFPESRERDAVINQARGLVEAGRGDTLIALPRWYYAISAKSLVDRVAEPEDFWIDQMNRSSSPLLMLWGEKEPRSALWRSLFERLDTETRTMNIVPGAGHYFQGFEQEVVDHMRNFLESLT